MILAASVAVLAAVLLIVGMRSLVVRSARGLTPERRAVAREFLASMVRIDPEVLQVPPMDAQLVHIAGLVKTEWQNQRDLLDSQPFTQSGSAYSRIQDLATVDMEATASEIIRMASGWLRNCSALVQHPGYELSVLLQPYPMDSSNELRMAEAAARLLALNATLSAKRGLWPEAYSRALDAMRFAVRPLALPLDAHTAAAGIVRGVANTLADLAQECRDPDAMRVGLAQMQALYGACNMDFAQSPIVDHMLGGIRMWRRYDSVTSLSAEMKGDEFFRSWRAGLLSFLELQTESLPATSQRRAAFKALLTRERDEAPFWVRRCTGGWMCNLLMGDSGNLLAFEWNMPDLSNVDVSARMARATYDLAMIAHAQQRYLLQNQKPALGMRDLVPAYLPTEPKDPFTTGGASYRWHERLQRFYSLGPDRRDDVLKLLHPGEPMESRGDVIAP